MSSSSAAEGSSEEACSVLARMPDYRVLRRLTPMVRFAPTGTQAGMMVGCALDCETTGLDHRSDAVLELALQRFLMDADGRIAEVGRSWRWMEDPGRPIEAHIARLTGIVDADVRGRAINEAEATGVIVDSDFVVAHNARFDRPFVERRLPDAAGRPWVCSMADVDWRGRRFEGRSLSHLLLQMGWFYDAHRADVDVLALLRLLDHRSEDGGATVLSEAVSTGSRGTSIVEAVDAPFAAKDVLKGRGYRWNPAKRFWWSEVPCEDLAQEIAWAEREVYAGGGSPRWREIDWTSRYGATLH